MDKIFKDKRVFIIGGGGSLKGFDFSLLNGHESIAVNMGYKTKANSRVLLSGDPRFFNDNEKTLWRFKGDMIVASCELPDSPYLDKRIVKVPYASLGGDVNSGLQAIHLAKKLGATEVVLLGFDCKYSLNKKNWHSTIESSPKIMAENAIYNHMIKCFNKFAKRAEKYKDFKIINANLHSDLECFEKKCISEYFDVPSPDDAEAEEEKIKYCRMWHHSGYRNHSLAERIIEEFISEFPKGSVIDYGCGTGRADKILHEKGYQVTMLDIAENCLDSDIRLDKGLNFIECTLWNVPNHIRKSDYCLSVDVLEHLPLSKVTKALEIMSRKTIKGGMIQICTVPDKSGALIGKTLHLTVKPADWWIQKVGKHFDVVKEETTDQHVKLFVNK